MYSILTKTAVLEYPTYIGDVRGSYDTLYDKLYSIVRITHNALSRKTPYFIFVAFFFIFFLLFFKIFFVFEFFSPLLFRMPEI